MKKFDIYEEGFRIMCESAKAHYLGYGFRWKLVTQEAAVQVKK